MECRLCLRPDPTIPIYGGPINLVHRIWMCCELRVTKDDGLSEIICIYCERTLELYVNFLELCHRSEDVLRIKYQDFLDAATQEILEENSLAWNLDLTSNNEINEQEAYAVEQPNSSMHAVQAAEYDGEAESSLANYLEAILEKPQSPPTLKCQENTTP